MWTTRSSRAEFCRVLLMQGMLLWLRLIHSMLLQCLLLVLLLLPMYAHVVVLLLLLLLLLVYMYRVLVMMWHSLMHRSITSILTNSSCLARITSHGGCLSIMRLGRPSSRIPTTHLLHHSTHHPLLRTSELLLPKFLLSQRILLMGRITSHVRLLAPISSSSSSLLAMLLLLLLGVPVHVPRSMVLSPSSSGVQLLLLGLGLACVPHSVHSVRVVRVLLLWVGRPELAAVAAGGGGAHGPLRRIVALVVVHLWLLRLWLRRSALLHEVGGAERCQLLQRRLLLVGARHRNRGRSPACRTSARAEVVCSQVGQSVQHTSSHIFSKQVVRVHSFTPRIASKCRAHTSSAPFLHHQDQ